jgi:hypothetical protein
LYVCSVFKPNAPLTKVVEELWRFGKCLTKQNHIVIVGGVQNSLDRHYYYLTEKDLNFIAERTTNTNVGFVNLFKSQSNTWMNGRVRSVNL